MVKRGKKAVVLSTILALTTTVAAACSSNNGSNSDPSSPPAGTTQPSAGASSQPAQKIDPMGAFPETVKFTTVQSISQAPKFPDGDSYDSNPFKTFVEQKLNIKADVLWRAPSDGDQFFNKLSLTVASGDLPDLFVISSIDKAHPLLKQLVDSGVVEDLTNVFNQYASDTVKANYAKAGNKALGTATFGNKLMAIPSQVDTAQTNVVWVRQDWLDRLGLPAPKTMDDLRKVADAFANGDPDGNGKKDTIGISVAGATGISKPSGDMHMLDLIFNNFGAYPTIWHKDKSGNIVWGGVQPEVKKALTLLADMYKNKEIDREFGVKNNSKTTEDLGSGKSGLVFQPWWAPLYPLQNTLQTNPGADWRAYAIPAADGHIKAGFNKVTNAYIVVRKGFKHPELAVKLVNVITAMKMNEFPDMSEKRLVGYKNAAEKWPVFPGMAGIINDPTTVEDSLRQIKDVIAGKLDVGKLDQEEKSIYEKIQGFAPLVGKPVPADKIPDWQQYAAWMYGLNPTLETPTDITFNEFTGSTPTMDKAWQSMLDLQQETFVKIIMGAENPDYFDTFVKKWEDLGGKKVTKEVQDAAKQ